MVRRALFVGFMIVAVATPELECGERCANATRRTRRSSPPTAVTRDRSTSW